MIIKIKINEFLENVNKLSDNKLLVIAILVLALTIMMSLIAIVLTIVSRLT